MDRALQKALVQRSEVDFTDTEDIVRVVYDRDEILI